MTVVNRFNVNKQQVTLDADIIENMSANDVPYDSSFRYSENTVGKKLSDLEYKLSELEYYVTGLMKSIGPTQKSFVVETNYNEGYIYIDRVKKTIPANSTKAFRFNNTFGSGNDNNSGIASFHFLVTDTSEITSMKLMFSCCSSLRTLDLSNFDTSRVTDMSYMFGYCESLTSLDLSNFNTSKVTNVDNMFDHCTSLTHLILGPNFFKTSNVTIIDFSSCLRWRNETVVTSLVTNSYNRRVTYPGTLTLQLHANTKAALTDEQKATITAKGYTIA